MVAKRVVVVDDEEDIRDLMVMWLRDDPRCTSVGEAEDLDAAVVAVGRDRPDAVLLDFFLGHRVCVEALPAMRTACPDAVIIVYTASRRAAEAAAVLAAGADMVVEKGSISVDDLVELLLGTERDTRPHGSVGGMQAG